jgi:hypothetical protein
MAKHCDVCNKSYPESEVRCPHCAGAEKAAGDPGSAVNLGEPYVAEVADADGPASPASASNVAWAALAEEVPADAPRIDSPSDRDLLAHAPATPPPAAGDAAVGDEPFVAEAADDANSAIDLAALAGQSAGGSSLHEAAPRSADQDEAAAAHFLDDAAEVEAGSGVNLGAPTRPTDRPSSRDLIAEAVESGVDVGGARAAGEAATEAEESSSDRVDLGSHAAGARADGHSGPSSEVDLGGKAARAKRRPASEPTSDVDLAGARGEQPTELDEEAAPAAADEEAERPTKARSGAGRALVGGAAGVLIGIGAAFALWLFGVEPPAGWKLVQGKAPASALRQQPPAPNPAPAPGAPAAADPARDLKNGDFARVVADLAQAAQPTPEALAQRGTARWMLYLQEQKAKNAALNPDDEAVKQARTDLETAAGKDNAEALLALGNLQEWTGAAADAVKTYQDGLKRFGNNGRWARVFQAQLNRLESASAAPADGGKPRAGANRAAQALVALLLAFQADQPAAEEDEAGFEFWSAVKSAKAGDYTAAVKSLGAARKAHDKLRFSRLRKAQNPLSDPTEEIFLRCANEIEAYWTLKNYLMQQNLVAKGDDPQKAIAAAVQGAATLQAQVKQVADKLGTTPDKLGASVEALVKEKDEASKKATALAAAAKGDADKLAQANSQLKAAEGKLKSVGDRLAAAGVKDAHPAKGIDALAAERIAADKVVSAVADKLAAANVKVDRKDVVQGVERVIEVARQNGAKGQPTARPPRSLAASNPLLAEAHYAAGLRAYFDGRFADAQASFAGAAQADDQDARYFYFLGLSRLALDNRADANANFEEGARLERENRPGRKAVSTALERVQGTARQALNRFRP